MKNFVYLVKSYFFGGLLLSWWMVLVVKSRLNHTHTCFECFLKLYLINQRVFMLFHKFDFTITVNVYHINCTETGKIVLHRTSIHIIYTRKSRTLYIEEMKSSFRHFDNVISYRLIVDFFLGFAGGEWNYRTYGAALTCTRCTHKHKLSAIVEGRSRTIIANIAKNPSATKIRTTLNAYIDG